MYVERLEKRGKTRNEENCKIAAWDELRTRSGEYERMDGKYENYMKLWFTNFTCTRRGENKTTSIGKIVVENYKTSDQIVINNQSWNEWTIVDNNIFPIWGMEGSVTGDDDCVVQWHCLLFLIIIYRVTITLDAMEWDLVLKVVYLTGEIVISIIICYRFSLSCAWHVYLVNQWIESNYAISL